MKLHITTDKAEYHGGEECLAQLLADIMKNKEFLTIFKEFKMEYSSEGSLGGKGIPITQLQR